MSSYKEIELMVDKMRKRLESAPKDTPKEVIWGWVEEFDQMVVNLDGSFDDDYMIIKT